MNLAVDQGAAGTASALNFVNACKGLPGTTLAFGTLAPASGNLWISGNTGSTMIWDSYNHFLPPNSLGCDNQNDGNTGGYASVQDGFPPSSNHRGASIWAWPTGMSISSRTQSGFRPGGHSAPATGARHW